MLVFVHKSYCVCCVPVPDLCHTGHVRWQHAVHVEHGQGNILRDGTALRWGHRPQHGGRLCRVRINPIPNHPYIYILLLLLPSLFIIILSYFKLLKIQVSIAFQIINNMIIHDILTCSFFLNFSTLKYYFSFKNEGKYKRTPSFFKKVIFILQCKVYRKNDWKLQKEIYSLSPLKYEHFSW